MRVFIKLIVLTAIFFTPACYSIGNVAERGAFEFAAEWIYFRPTIDSIPVNEIIYDAIGEFALGNFARQNDFSSLSSGWRAEAGYYFHPYKDRLLFRWTDFKTSQSKLFIPDNVDLLVTPVGQLFNGESLEDHVKFHYHSWEALLSHVFIEGCYFQLDLFGGIHYAWVNSVETFRGGAVIGTVIGEQRSHFWGIGPELGLNINYSLFNTCLSLVGRASSALLASRPLYILRNLDSDVSAPSFSTIQHIWKVVPSFDLRFGVEYVYAFRCLSVSLEAGYELLTYVHSLPFLSQSFVNQTAFNINYSDAQLNGPYLRFGILF